MNLDKISADLSAGGLNQLAVLDRQHLAEFDALAEIRSLLLIGNSGPDFWRKIPSTYFDRQHPVDDFAADTVTSCMAKYADMTTWSLLYPTARYCPPLQSLGKVAGWHYDSPLGLGVNPQWGLWFAYRAVVAVSIDLKYAIRSLFESPCVSCQSQACISACPGSAIAQGQSPDLMRCARYRLSPASACADTCISRLSCPVAPDLRYDEAQTNYHYKTALPALARWLQHTGSLRRSDVDY